MSGLMEWVELSEQEIHAVHESQPEPHEPPREPQDAPQGRECPTQEERGMQGGGRGGIGGMGHPVGGDAMDDDYDDDGYDVERESSSSMPLSASSFTLDDRDDEMEWALGGAASTAAPPQSTAPPADPFAVAAEVRSE